ncbi:14653_t:CDS:2 [Gigaspora rosea]|nr:14653_t:CDS:2 [Gigaspora rosea]
MSRFGQVSGFFPPRPQILINDLVMLIERSSQIGIKITLALNERNEEILKQLTQWNMPLIMCCAIN